MLAVGSDSSGSAPADTAYDLVAAEPTSRSTGDNSIQEVISVTARSKLYLVTYTWFVDPVQWRSDGAPALVGYKTSVVNTVCAHPHVQGFRTVQDQNRSRLLVNFAVISVGTDDGAIYDEVEQEMDLLDTPETYGKIDQTWKNLAGVAGLPV